MNEDTNKKNKTKMANKLGMRVAEKDQPETILNSNSKVPHDMRHVPK